MGLLAFQNVTLRRIKGSHPYIRDRRSTPSRRLLGNPKLKFFQVTEVLSAPSPPLPSVTLNFSFPTTAYGDHHSQILKPNTTCSSSLFIIILFFIYI